MSKLSVDESLCKELKGKMGDNLEAYTNSVNKVAELEGSISSAWEGPKAADFITQIENFLPNLTIGYNIIEKSKKDFSSAIKNIKNTDNN